jgi:hypothetical protein
MIYTIFQNVTECIFFLLFPTIKTKFKQAQGFTDNTFAHVVLKGHLSDKEKVVL